jgi:hypothetical protein
MLVVGLTFLAVIALGEAVRYMGARRKAARAERPL